MEKGDTQSRFYPSLMKSIEWEGKTIKLDDWDDNRTGYLVFQASSFKWNGTVEGLTTSLLAYLNGLPSKSLLCWPKTTIERLHLSGNLAFDNEVKQCTVFPARSYGVTKQELEEQSASEKDEALTRVTTEDERKIAFLKQVFGETTPLSSLYETFCEGPGEKKASSVSIDQKIEEATDLHILTELINTKFKDVSYH